MMKKQVLGVALSFAAALPAFADPVSDLVIANLRAQGFTVVQMDRTWLGRMWVVARNAEVQREVVFNPVTGEILRDYTVLLAVLNAPDQADTDRTTASSATVALPPGMMSDPPIAFSAEIIVPEPGVAKSVSAPINPVQ